jgi:hypothetical protein
MKPTKMILVNVTLMLTLVMLLSTSVFASEENWQGQSSSNATVLETIDVDGTIYEYYLDSDGNPYNYFNGKKIYMALPLEHLKVTDPDMLAYLSPVTESIRAAEANSVGKGSSILSAPPYPYYDLDSTGPGNIDSHWYTIDISFLNGNNPVTEVLKYNAQHRGIKIWTTNMDKGFLSGNKINVSRYYYDLYNDQWYNELHSAVDCAIINGRGFPQLLSIYQYGFFQFSPSDNVYACTVSIKTTFLW